MSINKSPWTWKWHQGNPIIINSEDVRVAEVKNIFANQAESNAKLICAAPELLETLIEVEDLLTGYLETLSKTAISLNYGNKVLNNIRRSIKKATD